MSATLHLRPNLRNYQLKPRHYTSRLAGAEAASPVFLASAPPDGAFGVDAFPALELGTSEVVRTTFDFCNFYKKVRHKHKKQNIKIEQKTIREKSAKEKRLTTACRASAIDRASAWPNFTQKDFMKLRTDLARAQEVSPRAAKLSISFFSMPVVCVQPD